LKVKGACENLKKPSGSSPSTKKSNNITPVSVSCDSPFEFTSMSPAAEEHVSIAKKYAPGVEVYVPGAKEYFVLLCTKIGSCS
jgi:hypothetical protein